MSIQISEMTAGDYEEALALWQRCPGMGLSDADEQIPLSRFLERNPGLSCIARDGELLIGTCLLRQRRAAGVPLSPRGGSGLPALWDWQRPCGTCVQQIARTGHS